MQDSAPSVIKTPEFPALDMPKFEELAAHATSAFREFAEKGLSQAKEAYTKARTAAEETTGMLETTYANASRGTADYGLKVVEMARATSNAAFDFTVALLGARTLSQVVEISTSHTRKQIELATEQAKELAALVPEGRDRYRRTHEGRLRKPLQEGRLRARYSRPPWLNPPSREVWGGATFRFGPAGRCRSGNAFRPATARGQPEPPNRARPTSPRTARPTAHRSARRWAAAHPIMPGRRKPMNPKFGRGPTTRNSEQPIFRETAPQSRAVGASRK